MEQITLPGYLFGEVREMLETKMAALVKDAVIYAAPSAPVGQGSAAFTALFTPAWYDADLTPASIRASWLELATIRERIIHGETAQTDFLPKWFDEQVSAAKAARVACV